MTTTKAFERFLRPLWVICIAGCATSAGTSGETHFQCSATPDCLKHGVDLVCVEGTCVSEGDADGAGGAGTGGQGATGGSTSTGDPARAAAYISVSPGNGSCSATHGLLAIPQDQRVFDALNCNLSSGCSPNELVAVDGDPETQVTCSVSAAGDDYSISARVAYQGSNITVAGVIGRDGGDVQMTHYFRERGVGLAGSCTLTLDENQGAVAPRRVWAHFSCPDFTDPSAAGGMDCAAEGAFLFERCDGG